MMSNDVNPFSHEKVSRHVKNNRLLTAIAQFLRLYLGHFVLILKIASCLRYAKMEDPSMSPPHATSTTSY